MINDKNLNDAIAEIQQPRSKFQLNHFVVGQHYTPEMQYYQLVLELNDMIFKHKQALLDLKIQQLKSARLRENGDEISELEAQKIDLNIEQTNLALIGSEREIEHLYAIWSSLPNKYSREEIENGQQHYWSARLTHDIDMQALSGAVNPSHLSSLYQAGMLEDFLESRAVQTQPEAPHELS